MKCRYLVLLHYYVVAAAAKLLQSCPTLCDPIDSSPSGSPVPAILQARTLEWVAISFSNAWKWKVKVKSLSRGWLLATPWTEAYQAPPSMGFSRQEYWSGVPLPSPYVLLKSHSSLMWMKNWKQCVCSAKENFPDVCTQQANGSPSHHLPNGSQRLTCS